MGTRSRIGMLHADHSITSIYTHWDGYPKHHGPLLSQHYNSADRLQALLALGDLSKLAPELGDVHGFEDKLHPTWCKAFGRDRRDKGVAAITHANLTSFLISAHDCFAEYVYLFSAGAWRFAAVPLIGAPCVWRKLLPQQASQSQKPKH